MYSNVTPPALPDYNPVGLYSYNGVELPALPEWDTAIYPYAYIGINEETGCAELWLYQTRLTALVNSAAIWVFKFGSGPDGGSYILQDGVWRAREEEASHDILPIWCNVDYYYTDSSSSSVDEHLRGTLYLAASEPVPVLAYPYSVMVYDYQKGAEDWYQVHLYYSGTPFTWNGEAVGNSGTVYKRIYDAAYDGWTEEAETEIEASPGLTGTTYQRIYTDHDIKDSAGNIWLAAGSVTEAVETVTEKWLRSFQTGLALGLTGKPLPIKKEPVAYLYNGERYQDINKVWPDKEIYPYALIHVPSLFVPPTDLSDALLVFSDTPFRMKADGYFDDTVKKWTRLETDENRNWVPYSSGGGASGTSAYQPLTGIVVWSNHDIYNEDGTLYLAASEPVPVYE